MATILMVDDEPILLDLYHDVLEPDHQVLLAGSVGEAIRILADQEVDAVGCDYHLGAGSGADVVAWIRAHRPNLLARTIIISGDEAPSVDGDGVLLLYKPVPIETLLEVFGAWFTGVKGHA